MIVGLTGGVATGKSEAARYFEALGMYIVDADAISRKLTAKGMPLLSELVMNLGTDILYSNGALNRKKLADMFFSNKEIKLKVEKILHVHIIFRINEIILQNVNKFDILIDVPLLFEVGLNKICDKVVVVHASYDVQVSRIALRDKLSYYQIKKRISSQMPIEQKIELADFSIDNTNSKKDLEKNVKDLYKLLTCKQK
ncbi:MAG: dephospho-CoA kinase [Endomicrobium sp.]|jgi:dephospho-CoA kinase|nr:dephospho-CoA kinase [Endomicrobium sp.]